MPVGAGGSTVPDFSKSNRCASATVSGITLPIVAGPAVLAGEEGWSDASFSSVMVAEEPDESAILFGLQIEPRWTQRSSLSLPRVKSSRELCARPRNESERKIEMNIDTRSSLMPPVFR